MNHVSGTPKKKSLEDLDAVDIIRFIWNQRLPILGSLLVGALIGLLFSQFKVKAVPTKAVTILFKEVPNNDLSYTLVNPDKLIEVLNTGSGREAFYSGALSVKNEKNSKILEGMTSEYFRGFVLSAERLSLDTIQIKLGMTSDFYFDNFEETVLAGISKVIEDYNNTQALPFFVYYEKLFEINNQIQGLMVEVAKAGKDREIPDRESSLFAYLKDIPSRSKFDHIAMMLKLIPSDSSMKPQLEKEAKDLFIRQTFLDQQIKSLLEQNKAQVPTPWKQLSLQGHDTTTENYEESFFSVAFPRVMTGIFLGLIVGFMLGGVRSFVDNNRERLADIFNAPPVLKKNNV